MEEPTPPRPRVHRVDVGLGLAVLRAPLSARSLVTYARNHVTVRTPSRPGYADGNTLDLEAPPAPGELAGWVERFGSTIGQLGTDRVQLRWEQPAPLGFDALPEPDPHLVAAAAKLDLALSVRVVLLLETLAPTPAAPVRIDPVEAPSAVPGGPVDRGWHAARVLYRYDQSEPGEQGWRDWDEDEVAWRVEVQRELALEGRARVWLAARHGTPVGRVTLTHDRQGLAVIDDLVVHPVHRGRGIAAALVRAAIQARLELDPAARVGMAVAGDSVGLRLARRMGLVEHALVWTVR